MCGRTSIGVSKRVLENYYRAEMPGEFLPTYNAAPSRMLPIVRNVSPQLIDLARWGFLPAWLKDKRPRGFINTRAETALEKPSFRSAVVSRRCLVPADGFFEWDDRKQPYYFTLPRRSLFSLAGIWEMGADRQGKGLITYSIMTTAADKTTAAIHGRMPVVLDRDTEKDWLRDSLTEADIKRLLLSPGGLELIHYPVARLVNSSKADGEKLIRKLTTNG